MNLSMLNLLPFIEWVASSPLSKAISTSTWAFAVIESIHLLALSVIGGAVLIVDLRLLGFGIKTQTLEEVARWVQPWFFASWAVMRACRRPMSSSPSGAAPRPRSPPRRWWPPGRTARTR